jgi:hypothetical protein
MMATQMLRQQHRDIEQEIALLEAHAHDSEEDFAALVVDLVAHLAAEAHGFYSVAEEALGQPLAEQRWHHERVRTAISRAVVGARDPESFPALLFELAEAFKAHTRAEERAVHPSLEGVLGGERLVALGAELGAIHSTIATTLRAMEPQT